VSNQRAAIVNSVQSWLADGSSTALATVIASTGSAPRGLGAQLAIRSGEVWVGGLSGGCAEAAVLHEARELMRMGTQNGRESGAAVRMSLTRDELGGGGPVCGATLDVLVEQVDVDLFHHLQRIETERSAGNTVNARRTYRPTGENTYVRTECVFPPRDSDLLTAQTVITESVETLVIDECFREHIRLVVAGAGDIATELISLAQQLGWRTTLLDPRQAFIDQTLSDVQPDETLCVWPDKSDSQLALDASCACVADSHDERIDLPFLKVAAASDAFYVGSVGSRIVQVERQLQLNDLVGMQRAQRHEGPAGIDLGGSGAAEIALSIIAQIVAHNNGRSGNDLSTSSNSIRAR